MKAFSTTGENAEGSAKQRPPGGVPMGPLWGPTVVRS